ncbi:MAG TPA: hypothetical protein VIF57_06955 [Polyangia bacterium]
MKTGRRAAAASPVGWAVLIAVALPPAVAFAAAAAATRPDPDTLPRPRCLWRMNGVTVARNGVKASLGPKAGTVLLQRGPRDTVVVDIRTGQLVGKPDPGPLHRPKDDLGVSRSYHVPDVPARDGGLLWTIAGDRVEARRTSGGHVERSLPLPPFLEAGPSVGLLVADGRIVVITPVDMVRSGGVIAVARADAPGWTLLRRPAVATDFVLASGVLLAAGEFDTTVAAFSLTEVEPPFAQLSPEAAVAAAKADGGHEHRLLIDHLIDLPQLGPFWLDQLRAPKAELHVDALVVLSTHPQPAALPLLLTEAPRRNRGEDHALAEALGSQDAPSAARRLLELAKGADAGAGARRYGYNSYRDNAYRAIWRTGRASELGLCTDTRERPVAALAKTAPDGSIGTPHPFIFQSVAADGGWTVLCQAREDTDRDGVITAHLGHHGDVFGDLMRPYLVVGSGPGMAADEFIAADPRGRYVAMREGACLSLVDTQRRSAVTLANADLRDDDGVFGSHRAVGFDTRGERMLYLRGSSVGERLVMRTLATGREIEFDPGPGLLWRAALDPAGRWVMAEIVAGSRWPQVGTTLAGRSCRGAAMSWSTFGESDSAPVIRRWAPTSGGRMQEVAGLIRPVAGGMLVRDDAGALAMVAADGKRTPVAAADCHGTLGDAEATGDALLVVCAPPRAEQGRMMLVAGGSATYIQMARVPARDSWTGARDGVLMWDGNWADVNRRAAIASPAWRPDEARETTTWNERDKGVFATRGDKKMELRRPPSLPSPGDVPDGPLKWIKVGASP